MVVGVVVVSVSVVKKDAVVVSVVNTGTYFVMCRKIVGAASQE